MKLMLNGKEVSGMGHYVMAGDIKDATAEDSNVLSGKVYYNNNGKREGTMPNRGGMSAELAAGGSVGIPEGYHNGEGVVRAQDLASQTAGTAAAANIEAGYTAWVNGALLTGSMLKGKKIKTGQVSGSGETYFSFKDLDFKPEGFCMFYLASSTADITLNNTVIAAFAIGSNGYLLQSKGSSNPPRHKVASSVTITDNSITISDTLSFYYAHNFRYIVWGE